MSHPDPPELLRIATNAHALSLKVARQNVGKVCPKVNFWTTVLAIAAMPDPTATS
jgi:hypothetical protein